MKSSLVLLLFAASTLALAAPPVGHPGPADAMPKAQGAVQSGHQGRVVSSINTDQYTYIEVTEGDKTGWIAAPAVAVKPGNVIRFEDGAMMTNFHSKLLNRTFPSVMFVGRVVVTAAK